MMDKRKAQLRVKEEQEAAPMGRIPQASGIYVYRRCTGELSLLKVDGSFTSVFGNDEDLREDDIAEVLAGPFQPVDLLGVAERFKKRDEAAGVVMGDVVIGKKPDVSAFLRARKVDIGLFAKETLSTYRRALATRGRSVFPQGLELQRTIERHLECGEDNGCVEFVCAQILDSMYYDVYYQGVSEFCASDVVDEGEEPAFHRAQQWMSQWRDDIMSQCRSLIRVHGGTEQ